MALAPQRLTNDLDSLERETSRIQETSRTRETDREEESLPEPKKIVQPKDELEPVTVSDEDRFEEEKTIDVDHTYRQTSMPEPQPKEPKQEIDISGSGSAVAISACGDIEKYPQYLDEVKKAVSGTLSGMGNGAKDFIQAKKAVEQAVQTFTSNLPDSSIANNVAQCLNSLTFHQGGATQSGRTKIGTFNRKESAKEIISQSKTKSENSEMFMYGGLALIAILLLK